MTAVDVLVAGGGDANLKSVLSARDLRCARHAGNTSVRVRGSRYELEPFQLNPKPMQGLPSADQLRQSQRPRLSEHVWLADGSQPHRVFGRISRERNRAPEGYLDECGRDWHDESRCAGGTPSCRRASPPIAASGQAAYPRSLPLQPDHRRPRGAVREGDGAVQCPRRKTRSASATSVPARPREQNTVMPDGVSRPEA